MDYAFTDRPVRLRACDCAGCDRPGDYRAPRSRGQLNDYYWFCLDHVREYNSRWDYFSGMNEAEVEAYTRAATVWERPSWPMGDWNAREQKLRDKVMDEFFSHDHTAQRESPAPPMPDSERDALRTLELSLPVTFDAIKAQYRMLVKRHHPDANGGSTEAEERFKNINQAFFILKKLYNSTEDA